MHLFLYGKSGTAKTAHVQSALARLHNMNGLLPIYVSCHEHVTKTAIFNKIAGELGNSFSSKGFAAYELFGRIKEILENDNKSVLLVLDDFDALLKNEGPDILYQIINANEARKHSFAVIAISNDIGAFEHLDAKIKSSLMFQVIEFEPYKKEEIMKMLEAIAEETLVEGSYDEEILDRIAEIGALAEGNTRLAAGLLLETARNAEKRSSTAIEDRDISEVCERLFLATEVHEPNGSGLSVEELRRISGCPSFQNGSWQYL
ncbi:MAG: AAA family ATPase [Candidatus Micrarchaeota archaeon]|nr:AAA family ATPase [Candidatus Micrarchaeota archaeon]